MGEKFKATGRKAMMLAADIAIAMVFGVGMMLVGAVIICAFGDNDEL